MRGDPQPPVGVGSGLKARLAAAYRWGGVATALTAAFVSLGLASQSANGALIGCFYAGLVGLGAGSRSPRTGRARSRKLAWLLLLCFIASCAAIPLHARQIRVQSAEVIGQLTEFYEANARYPEASPFSHANIEGGIRTPECSRRGGPMWYAAYNDATPPRFMLTCMWVGVLKYRYRSEVGRWSRSD